MRQRSKVCALRRARTHCKLQRLQNLPKKNKDQQPRKTTAVQRLQEKSKKAQIPTNPSTCSQTYVQVTDKTRNEQTKLTNNEPTISDLMQMLSQFQTEMKGNFSQLSAMVERLEKSRPSASESKKKQN